MLHRNKPRKYVTPLCVNGFCDRCPGLVRAHRFTDNGTELREMVCKCDCGHPGK